MVTGVVMAVTLFEFTFCAFLTHLAVTAADDTLFLEHLRADAFTIIGVVRTPSPRQPHFHLHSPGTLATGTRDHCTSDPYEGEQV